MDTALALLPPEYDVGPPAVEQEDHDMGGTCLGALLNGGVGCDPDFVPGGPHFKNKFCDSCRAPDNFILVPLAQARALSAAQAACFVNKRSKGFWNPAPASMGGGQCRIINNTAGCIGPWLALFRSQPPDLQWPAMPEHWATEDDGYLRLCVAKGTLVPAKTLRCGHPQASAKRRKLDPSAGPDSPPLGMPGVHIPMGAPSCAPSQYAPGARRPGAPVKIVWSVEEDQQLLQLVHTIGPRWSAVAAQLPGRVGKQCRERWHNHLCPSVNKEDWTEEEEQLIMELVQQVGTKWALIAKRLPGRTDNAIKNRWNSIMRMRMRRQIKEQRGDAIAMRTEEPDTLEHLQLAPATVITNAQLHSGGQLPLAQPLAQPPLAQPPLAQPLAQPPQGQPPLVQPPLKVAKALPAGAMGIGMQPSFQSLQSGSFDSEDASPTAGVGVQNLGVQNGVQSVSQGMQNGVQHAVQHGVQSVFQGMPNAMQGGVPSVLQGLQNGLQNGLEVGQNRAQGEPPGGMQSGMQGGMQGRVQTQGGMQGGLEGALNLQGGLQGLLQEHGVQDLLQGLNDYKSMLQEYTTQLQTLHNQEMEGRQGAHQEGS